MMPQPGEARLYVLDSYAVLAWLEGERGGALVSELLTRAHQGRISLSMSVISLGEVLYIIEREDSVRAAQIALATIDSLPISQVNAGRELTLNAARFKARYRMSYADCFGLALAKTMGAALVTGDPELRLQNEVDLTWVGP